MIESGSLFEPIHIDILKGEGGFEPPVLIRDHIGGEDLRIAVVVEIGHVGTHRSQAGMTHAVFQFVLEGAVALVDIEIVFFKKIIGDIDVGPAVLVDISHHDP